MELKAINLKRETKLLEKEVRLLHLQPTPYKNVCKWLLKDILNKQFLPGISGYNQLHNYSLHFYVLFFKDM